MTIPPVSELTQRARSTLIAFPLGVYALSRLLQLAFLWWMAPDDRVRDRLLAWDGGHFVRVAEQGYPTGYSYDGAGNLTGNGLAFFPGYPMLVRFVHYVTQLDYGTSAITVSWLAGAAAAVLICALGTRLYNERVGLILTALFCVQPMSMSLSMAYSEALFTALVAGMLVAAHRRAWLIAGVLGLCAGLTRPTGAAAAIALAVAAVIALYRTYTARRARAAYDGPPSRADAAAPLRADATAPFRADRDADADADADADFGFRTDGEAGYRAAPEPARGAEARAVAASRTEAGRLDARVNGRVDAAAPGAGLDAPDAGSRAAAGTAWAHVEAGGAGHDEPGAWDPADAQDARPRRNGTGATGRAGAGTRGTETLWRPLLGALIALAGVPAYLIWVGLRVGSLGAWFDIQTAGWGTTFDYGSSSLQFVSDALRGGDGWIQVSIAWMLIGTVILAAVALSRRVWPPLAVYGLIVLVLVLGQGGYYHSKPRLLVPALLILVPPALALSRARPRTAVLVLAALGAFGLWYGSYLITVWHYAI